jgi:hypothetical protein
MAEPEVQIAAGDDDVVMQGDDANAGDEVPETGTVAEDAGAADEPGVDKNAPRVTFAE